MSTPILATKLYVPSPRPKVIPRARLFARLNEGAHGKLTLISAPAGFGKTTLVGEWLAAGDAQPRRPVAWLSLDDGDGDLTRFLAYFIAALQTIAPQLGEGALAALRSSQPPPSEALLTALINEIAALPDDFVLVLDDYHVVDSPAVDQALSFLLEHQPPQLHLVITTREDPQLPLARLRVRGQMTEVRADDLRFTTSEAADFLHQAMGLTLTPEQVAALEARTEGWIAGLQLAALSMRGRADVAGFVKAFAGDNRYVVEYLVEEVLRRQPPRVREFLLQTSILARLCDPLCDAVTGGSDGMARLDALERGNFFVVPLDDKRTWYRYHHLFADVLAAHLRSEQPDLVPMLHRRACAWYEQNGLRTEAIRHALAAEDFAHAAALVELALPEMRVSRQEATLLSWLKALPDAWVRARPVLSVHYAGVLLQCGHLEGVESRLQAAEEWLATEAAMTGSPPPAASDSPPVVLGPADYQSLRGWLANYRAGYALVQGDTVATVAYARQALDLMPADELLGRGAAAALLGLAYWTRGELEAAYQTYAEGMARVRQAGHVADAIGGVIALADIRMAQGRLHDAMNIYARGLQLATAQQPEGLRAVLRGTADMYVGLSELARERNDLSAATQHLLHSQALGEHTGFPQYPYRWRVAMARIREAEGDLDAALDLLQAAERLYVSDFFPNVRPLAARRVRIWIVQGRLGEALDWVQAQGLSDDDELSYLREFEHITLARLRLGRYTHEGNRRAAQEAIGLLDRLLEAAVAGKRMGSALEILVLQALTHHLLDDLPAARLPLERALALAEPEGAVRVFVDEGPAMRLLLEDAAKHGVAPNYARQLLAAFGGDEGGAAVDRVVPARQAQSMSEPLSERELDVLRLLVSDLNGPEMARHLMVSLNTLHTHTKNIYSKLGVNNRRAAVRRAEELELL